MDFTPLSYFADLFKGKTGFVCGAGTSLKNTPKNLCDWGRVIAVNSAAVHFDKVDYLFVTDTAENSEITSFYLSLSEVT